MCVCLSVLYACAYVCVCVCVCVCVRVCMRACVHSVFKQNFKWDLLLAEEHNMAIELPIIFESLIPKHTHSVLGRNHMVSG